MRNVRHGGQFLVRCEAALDIFDLHKEAPLRLELRCREAGHEHALA